ncbi:MAG: outer membrane beta-barrel protein [Bacteroidetes bacterium]|nr:outer membrane beta-barrel protein [Bacteroidota bacterium]
MMKENKDMKPFDDLFRQTLEGYTPPPPAGAWKNIRRSLAKSKRSRWHFLFSLPVIILVSVVMFSIIGILVFSRMHSAYHSNLTAQKANRSLREAGRNENASDAKSKSSMPNPQINPLVTDQASITETQNHSPLRPNIRNEQSKVPAISSGHLSDRPEKQGSPKLHAGYSATSNSQEKGKSSNTVSIKKKSSATSLSKSVQPLPVELLAETEAGETMISWVNKTTSARETEIAAKTNEPSFKDPSNANNKGKDSLLTSNPNTVSAAIPDQATNNSARSPSGKQLNNDSSLFKAVTLPNTVAVKKRETKTRAGNRFESFASLGGNFGQVVISGLDPQPFYSAAATFGLNLAKYRTSVETGLGFSQYRDKGLYEFEFRKIDTSGYTGYTYFNPLDSSYLIIFRANVDTQQIFREVTTRSTFTYLDIPFYLTHELFRFGKLTIGIKAGPEVSFLVTRKEVLPELILEGAEFVNLKNMSYSRLSMNWQVLVATRFSWQFNEHLSLILQPSANLYLKNLYDKNNKPKSVPFGISVYGGLQYKF